MKIIWVGLIYVLFIIIFSLNHVSQTSALAVNSTCTKVEVIFARGSGNGVARDDEANRFFDQIKNRIKYSTIQPSTYALGTESYDGHQYQHVDVGDFKNWNSLGAATSAGLGNDYGKSVDSGVKELQSYLGQRYNKCKSTGTYYVLGGYSQGAQVIGQALPGLSLEIRNRIIFVGLFGDPKLYLPEGEGGSLFNAPDACRGKNLSLYRRSISDCNLSEGRLGARKKSYLPSDMEAKTGLWCYEHDFVCGTTPYWWETGHETYKNPGLAIDAAAKEAATRLKDVLKKDGESQSSNSGSLPVPPDYGKLIDTTYHLGMGQNGQDVLFVIDRSPEMEHWLPKIRQYIKDTTPKIVASGGHVTVAAYCSAVAGPDVYMTAVGMIRFDVIDPNMLINGSYINTFTQICADTHSAAVLYALNSSTTYLNWHSGAAKSVIFFSNSKSPIKSPDPYGITNALLANTALAIDPVNVYPVVPLENVSLYQDISSLTSGQIVPVTGDDLVTAADVALDKIYNRPAVFLKNSEYIANPGQEIIFDASGSYVINGAITKYDWDFNGDGTIDTSTANAVVSHTYTNKFDGLMQVRVTASNSTIANASATVKIGTYIPPVTPAPPTNLTATVVSTVDGESTVHLSWVPSDDLTAGWSLSVNGVSLGVMTPDRTSIDVTDVDRSIDVDFGITGVSSSVEFGSSASVTLEKPYTKVVNIDPGAITTADSPQVTQNQNSVGDVEVASVSDSVSSSLDADTDVIGDVLGASTNVDAAIVTGIGQSWWIFIASSVLLAIAAVIVIFRRWFIVRSGSK